MRRLNGWLLVLLFACLALAACNEDDGEDDTVADDSVQITLRVDQDEVFGFVQDEGIGYAKFSDHDGLVGTRIKCEIFLDDLARFENAVLTGRLELINENAIKADTFVQEFTVDRDTHSFFFYIPQILTVPILLDFRLSLTYEEENVQQTVDHFEASLVYEFNVSTGKPATF